MSSHLDAIWITVIDSTLAPFSSCLSVLAPSNLFSIQRQLLSKCKSDYILHTQSSLAPQISQR